MMYRVAVLPETSEDTMAPVEAFYDVEAETEEDALLLALLMDEGAENDGLDMPSFIANMEPLTKSEMVELAKMYCRLVPQEVA